MIINKHRVKKQTVNDIFIILSASCSLFSSGSVSGTGSRKKDCNNEFTYMVMKEPTPYAR